MREGHRNEMFSSMIADVIEGNPDFRFELERIQQPAQQEQRIWALDSDEEDPTEEARQKKRAKNKKKYLRKKEKASAGRTKREEEKGEEKDGVEQGFAGLAVQEALSTPLAAVDREMGNGNGNTAAADTPPQQHKLSKRQKKTLLKKVKQAQNSTSTPELAASFTTGNSASISNNTKFRSLNHDDKKKKNKVDGKGHKESQNEDEKEAATESEFKAVMHTVAKRFGQ